MDHLTFTGSGDSAKGYANLTSFMDEMSKYHNEPGFQSRPIKIKINDFDKPIIMCGASYKVFSIKGASIVRKYPIMESETNIYIVDDDEIIYHLDSYNTIYVTCGKKFGKREVDTLLSIILKFDDKAITLRIVTIKDNNLKSTRWVDEYSQKVNKLNEQLTKYLGEIWEKTPKQKNLNKK